MPCMSSCVFFSFLICCADCIGSAFNMKGEMQCPNCRKVEKGQWLYANGSTCSFPEFTMDDWNPDEDSYDLSYSAMVKHFSWFANMFQDSFRISKFFRTQLLIKTTFSQNIDVSLKFYLNSFSFYLSTFATLLNNQSQKSANAKTPWAYPSTP